MEFQNQAFLPQQGCACGKEHVFHAQVHIGAGVLKKIPQILEGFGAGYVFLLADPNTYRAAGQQVEQLLQQAGIGVCSCVLQSQAPEPDEVGVGYAFMHADPDCDMVVAVGSGVVNDIGKLVAHRMQKPYMIVGTAPSMDGYASATSSMTRGGLKISLPSKCADVILGDTDILCQAPVKLMVSGLGDMLAKYVSICEWRISHLINGEYYCPHIAAMVRQALERCVSNASGLLKREPEAVQAVFEGLVLCGAAMKYAGVSRPASGVEHYLSHVWDMRAAEFGTPAELHGIQCAVGTRIAVGLYEKVKQLRPSREKAIAYTEGFDYRAYSLQLRDFLGKSAEDMIRLEAKEGKYDLQSHKQRLEVILENWEQLLQIVEQELPSAQQLEQLLEDIGCPKTMEQLGLDGQLLTMSLYATKDIRDKYVLSRLLWDMGELEEIMA